MERKPYQKESPHGLTVASPPATRLTPAALTSVRQQPRKLLREAREQTRTLLRAETDSATVDAALERAYAALCLPEDYEGWPREDLPADERRQLGAAFRAVFSGVSDKQVAAFERLVDDVTAQMQQQEDEDANAPPTTQPGSSAAGLLALRRRAFGHKLPFALPRFLTAEDRARVAEEERRLVAKEHRQARARESRALRQASDLAGVAAAANSAASAASASAASAASDSAASAAASGGNDAAWLRSALEQHFSADQGAAGAGTMYSAVTDCLETATSEEALQNALFELLGFERFDLIQDILQRKSGILRSATAAATAAAPAGAAAPSTRGRPAPTAEEIALATAQLAAVSAPGGLGGSGSRAPAVAGSVTIQTEEEKRLAKQLRKEERRVRKQANAVLSAAEAAGDGDLQDLILDRQRALEVQERAMQEMAAQAILDRAHANAGTKTERFPFVFDALAETKKSAAYVSGSQIMLPSNCERRNEARAEEVTLPPVRHHSAMAGERLVAVRALGEIAQQSLIVLINDVPEFCSTCLLFVVPVLVILSRVLIMLNHEFVD